MVCIVCPVGCRMTVRSTGDTLEVSGNACARGVAYAKEEATMPLRMVTANAHVQGGALPLVSVKTATRVPKDKIGQVLAQIAQLRLQAPVAIGQVLIEDVAGTGVPVVATRTITRAKP